MSTHHGPSEPVSNAGRTKQSCARGFTLIEMSIIIVIIGIILGAGTLAWNAVTEGRKLAKAKSTLYEVRSCLVRRMFYNNTYPSYTGDGTTATSDNVLCDDTGAQMSVPDEDVDSCLCNVVDPWGHPVFYVEGVVEDPAGEALSAGTKYVTDNPAQGVNATNPDRTGSVLTDLNGNTVNYVVFVLISAGSDGLLDDSSYRDLFDGGVTPSSMNNILSQAAPMNTTDPPDFDRTSPPDYTVSWDITGDDDIYVYLTAPELRTALAQ